MIGDAISAASAVLLTMRFQHEIARLSQFWTILLKAGQNGEVALVHHQSAVALDIASASLLLIRCAASLLLGDGPGRQR
jgi:hypothetical protein